MRSILLVITLLFTTANSAPSRMEPMESRDFDVVVFGANPGGIAAALSAARSGRTVALIAPGSHIGGLMSSGLSITDVRFMNAFGGLFSEMIERCAAFYRAQYGADSKQLQESNNGLWFEPHVAERVFEDLVAQETKITLFRNYRLVRAIRQGTRLQGLVVAARSDLKELALEGGVTIDASYEGDAAAAAGASFAVGREARHETWEPYAGRVFLKNPGLQILPGSTGEGDERVQAYNFRLCLTQNPEKRAAVERPASYRREEFAPLIEAVAAGTVKSFQDVVRVAPIANGKYSANNSPIIRSLDLPAENYDYPTASEERRAVIVGRYQDYTLGLLWFLQHDAELPAAFRQESQRWGLCRDEFVDNRHLPYELYVREARRINGRKRFSAFDAFMAPGEDRTPLHNDSVAVADYHVDSHLVQRQQGDFPQIEGHVYLRPLSKPAMIPYGIMVPREIENLLVTGALSATHLGFGALRLEPVWMALGQAAGAAASLALETKVRPSEVSVSTLQRRLLKAGQVIAFFHDQPGPDQVWMQLNRPQERSRQLVLSDVPAPRFSPGIQFFGARGFFASYYARPFDPLTRSEAVRWLTRFAELEGLKLSRGPGMSIPDVPATHPDADLIGGMLKAGIAEGWAGTSGFYPSAPVSRADAVRWIVRLKILSRDWKLRSTEKVWSDVPTGHPDRQHFQTLEAVGALPRRWTERVQPGFYITREEFCDLLFAVFEERLNEIR